MEALLWLKMNLPYLLLVCFSIGLTIMLHEFGHFIAARRAGITVYEFSVGFGPKIWQKKYDDTIYTVRLFPMGGFVNIKGLDEPDDDPNTPNSYQNTNVWQKMSVVFYGPLFNYIGALILFWFVGLFFGIGQFGVDVSSQLAEVLPNKPAAIAGVKKFDTVLSVNGKTVKDGKEMVRAINALPNKEITLKILRGKQEQYIKVKSYVGDKGQGLIGIRPALLLNMNFVKAPLGKTLLWGLEEIWRYTIAPIMIVVSLLNRDISPSMVGEGIMGPIGIGQLLFEVSKKGIPCLLLLSAVVSVALGITNLLPIPALDGMRLLLLLIGGIRGRQFDPKKEAMVHTVGFYALMVIFVLLTKQDIERIVRGQIFFK